MNIYPSILTSEFDQAREQLAILRNLGGVIQWDVVDGQYAETLTLEPLDITPSEFEGLQVDVHLMTVDPSQYLGSYVEADYVRAVIAQVERLPDPQDFLNATRDHGWKAGFSFDLYTPVEEYDGELLRRADIIQLMGVQAGRQGQAFHSEILEKMAFIRPLQIKNPELEIIIDGGVKKELLRSLSQAGVHSVVVGSALWMEKDPADALEELRSEAGDLSVRGT